MAQQQQRKRRRNRKPSGTRKASGRTATVDVRYPKHVPVELRPIWTAAAKRVAKAGKLVRPVRLASGKTEGRVDYYAVNATYGKILAAYGRIAEEAQQS